MGKVKVFCYNQIMTDLDKFFSDADRIASRASKDEAAGGHAFEREFREAITRLFLSWTRDYAGVGDSLAEYWGERYAGATATAAGRAGAIEWFGNVLALLSGCFPKEADFPDDDWAEIRDTVSAEADTLDLDIVTGILSVVVERGKAY